MADYDDRRKGELIKKALIIVDELADVIDEAAEFTTEEQEELIELVDRAKKLKKDRLWKLK